VLVDVWQNRSDQPRYPICRPSQPCRSCARSGSELATWAAVRSRFGRTGTIR
jgi:hypothetical protein